MKRQILLIGAALLTIVVLAGAALWYAYSQVLAERPEVRNAARMLLDQRVLVRIERVDFYSGGPTFYVFTGEDETGRRAYVWVQGDRLIFKRYADEGLSPAQALEAAKGVQPALVRLIHAVPGLTEVGAASPGDPPGPGDNRRVLWELFGLTQNGQYEYVYVDWETGQVVRSYVLQS